MLKRFEGMLDENTSILENVVANLRTGRVMKTKITPSAFQSLHVH